jgi:hypothetical protein
MLEILDEMFDESGNSHSELVLPANYEICAPWEFPTWCGEFPHRIYWEWGIPDLRIQRRGMSQAENLSNGEFPITEYKGGGCPNL